LSVPLWVVITLLLLIGALLVYAAMQKWRPRLQNLSRGLLITYATITLILSAGELYFRYVYADSGWSFTLAHQNWERRYWQTNSRGFRDREWTPQDWQGKTIVTVLGDSFAAGWGVNEPADRFPDVLARLLGEDYAVINLAMPGKSTRSELQILKDNPTPKPDIVILQYFLNDIEDASAGIGRFWEADFSFAIPPQLVQESYLVNFIYWRLYPLFGQVTTTFEGSYWQWEYDSYDNFRIWDLHRQEIDNFIDYVDSIGARLIVVIFPNMEDSLTSIAYVDRVAQAFEAKGETEILRLYDDVAAWKMEDAVVSPRDAHPSAAFHRYVGQKIYEMFFRQD
jgi:lysophospholipase L1-like esterase